jgi:hypothetical protein
LNPKLFGLHSIRSGVTTSGALNGESVFWLKQGAGWSEGSDMPLLYAKMQMATDVERALRSVNLVRPREKYADNEPPSFWAQAFDQDRAALEGVGANRPSPAAQSSHRPARGSASARGGKRR